VPTACVVALVLATSATAQVQGYTDLRSPDTRDAAQAAEAQAQQPGTELAPEPAAPTVVETGNDSGDTLPLVLSSMALVIALAGIGVALSALLRRPRPRWTAR
jgi:hypothetical protein